MTRSAFLVVALGMFALSGPARGDAAAEAAKAMEQGTELLQKGEYEQAIARFNDARKVSPTSSGPYLGLGLAYRASNRCDEAVMALEEYLRRKVKDPRPEAKTAIEGCRSRMSAPGKLHVDSTPVGAEVRLDAQGGPALGATPFDLASVPPGAHKVYVSKSGYQGHVAEVKIEAGAAAVVSAALVLVPPPPPPPVPGAPPPAPAPDPAATPVTPPPVVATRDPNSKTDELLPVETPGAERPAAAPAFQSTTAHLTIVSSTRNASIFINGDRVSANGTVDLDLPPGLYGVTVEREGYVGAAGSVTLLAGERKSFTTELKLVKRHGLAALGGVMTIVALGGAGAATAGHILADRSVAGTGTFDTYHQLEMYSYIGMGSAAGLATLFFILDYTTNRGRVDESAPPPLVPVRP